MAKDPTPHLLEQIERLARFIQEEIPGEPSRGDEGAVDCMIRIVREHLPEIRAWRVDLESPRSVCSVCGNRRVLGSTMCPGCARKDALASLRFRTIDFVCATPPGPDSDFVEVESPPGTGFALGEWLQRDDRYWVLRFRAAIEEPSEAPARPELPTHPDTPEASKLSDVVSGVVTLERDPVFPRYLYIPTLLDPKVPRGYSIIARNVAELDHYAPHLPQADRDLLVSILQSVDGKQIPFVRLYGVGVSGNPADYPEHVSAMVIETSERLEREDKC